jgi:hypothetical protein
MTLKNCHLAGYVSKIVNFMDNYDKAQIDVLAKKIWEERGAGISTKKQKDKDFKKALRLTAIKVCREAKSKIEF